MSVVSKSENGNYPMDLYIFGKGVFTGGQLPIKNNIESTLGTAKNIFSGAANMATNTAKAATSTFDIFAFIKSNWKLVSIGAVALVVLLKR